MNINDAATRCKWQVADMGDHGRSREISGWDFGGEGDLALLHHANGMCAAMWMEVALPLTERYRVFAMDARGHGDSAAVRIPEDYDWLYLASDIAEVAKQLLKKYNQGQIAHGIGSSFGGIVTAAAEANYPGLFKRITMLDPPIHPTAEIMSSLSLDIVAGSSGREGLVEQTLKRRDVWPNRATAYDAWRQKPLFAPWQEVAFQLYLDEGMRDLPSGEVQLKCSPKVEAHVFQTTGDLGLFDYAPKVNIPVKVVHAKRGHFPGPFFRKIAEVFPQGEFAQLDAGHMLPLEIPDEVISLLLDRP